MSRALGILIGVGLVILGGCERKGAPVYMSAPTRAPSSVGSDSAIAEGANEVPAAESVSPPGTVPSANAVPPATEAPGEQPPSPPEVSAVVRQQLVDLGAKVQRRPDGYFIFISGKQGFTDKELDVVIQCPQVVDLTLEDVAITAAGLAKLEAFPTLSRLVLNDCPIASAELQSLAKLPLKDSLMAIGLRGTQVTDDDLPLFKQFARLERLDLANTAVSDAGLAALESLPLKVLDVRGTKVSAAGLASLQEKNPGLAIR